MVRFGFKFDERNRAIVVRAVEDGRRIAEVSLDIIRTSELGAWWWELGQEAEGAGEEQEDARYLGLVAEAEKLDRCIGALEAVGDYLGRPVESVSVVTDSHTSQLDLDELRRLYNVAASVSGRHGAAIMAAQCTSYVIPTLPDPRLPRVWKDPAFALGGVVAGPVAYVTPALPAAQAANESAAGRAGNLRRVLLRP